MQELLLEIQKEIQEIKNILGGNNNGI